MVDFLTTVWLTGVEPQAERPVEPVWTGFKVMLADLGEI